MGLRAKTKDASRQWTRQGTVTLSAPAVKVTQARDTPSEATPQPKDLDEDLLVQGWYNSKRSSLRVRVT